MVKRREGNKKSSLLKTKPRSKELRHVVPVHGAQPIGLGRAGQHLGLSPAPGKAGADPVHAPSLLLTFLF